MTDLRQQLRNFCEGFDEAMPTIEIDEIFEERIGNDAVRLVQPRQTVRRPVPGWAIAAIAAAVTVAIGAVGFLLARDPNSGVATFIEVGPTVLRTPASTPTTADVAAGAVVEADSLFTEMGTITQNGGFFPAAEATPDEPITVVSSAVGDIEWHVRPAQPFQSLVAFGRGFAAHIGDDDENAARVMTSENGLDWNSFPSPVSTWGLLAARGNELYVIARESPTEAYMTTDLGTTWTPIPLDPPRVGLVRNFVAGPAGVVIETRNARQDESLVWVLVGDTFESVAFAPSPIAELFALDDGFLATESYVPGWEEWFPVYWVSADGLNWTEMSYLSRDETRSGWFDIHSVWGNNVYAATGIDWGIISADGGGSWSEPTFQPGGSLVAGDAGYFTIGAQVVWGSPNGITWEQVLYLSPPETMDDLLSPELGGLVLSGNTIFISSEVCDDGEEDQQCWLLDWIGVVN
jgi:hypothetical protein